MPGPELPANLVRDVLKALDEARRGRTPDSDQSKAWSCRDIKDEETQRDYRVCLRPGWNEAQVTDDRTGITYDVAITERVNRSRIPDRLPSSPRLPSGNDDCGCGGK